MGGRLRVGLVLVCGLVREDVQRAGALLRGPATVVVEHDLRGLREGIVERRVSGAGADDEAGGGSSVALELAHGCVSCTLREDLLPLLLRLGRNDTVERIVVLLDPGVEPGAVCEALHSVVLENDEADEGVTVLDVLEMEATVAVLDASTWLADAGSDDDLADRGLALTSDDDRMVAQVVVGQAEFADLILLAGTPPDGWDRVRLEAVLDRLAPRTTRDVVPGAVEGLAGSRPARPDVMALLADLPPSARRGMPDDPHGPLLRGEPPLDADAGVSLLHLEERRPFHPTRLHEAFDVLLQGTVRIRGRLWVASQPDTALWVETAGGGLQIGHAGRWLAACDPQQWDEANAERRAGAALRWHERFGDREQQLVVLTHQAEPEVLLAALEQALLTDDELALGEESWRRWEDPFVSWHTDPCDSAGVRDLSDDSRPGGTA